MIALTASTVLDSVVGSATVIATGAVFVTPMYSKETVITVSVVASAPLGDQV